MSDHVVDPRFELVYGEALRVLALQQTLVDSLRTRATLLMAAAALPGIVAANGDLGWTVIVAATGLAGVVVCVFVICAPWWRWRLRTDIASLLENIDAGHGLDSLRRNLAISYERWAALNQGHILHLQWWFTAGLSCLVVELAAWIAHGFGW